MVTSTPKPTVVRDPGGDAPAACKDIRTVHVRATTTRVKFKVVMGAKPAARPCRGKSVPVVFIDTDSDGNGDCQTTTDNTGSSVRCGSEVAGPYKTSIDADNPLQWDLSFPTKVVGSHRSFRIQVATVSSGQFDDIAPDGSTEATVKVG
jgi:hypothetical protein